MAKRQTDNGPWPWRLLAGSTEFGISLYSVYYEEQPYYGINKDTPAMDAKGRFLWCSSSRKIGAIYARVVHKLTKAGMKKGLSATLNIGKALGGLDYEERRWEFWSETIDLLNMLLDYLEFLPNDAEDKKTIQLLGELSDHMLMEDDLLSFYAEHKTDKRRIIQLILYSSYRVYENSRIV